jgi:UDPglucose 6-dehydrogenase
VLLTEWESFRALDFAELRDCMRQPVMIDFRSIYPPGEIRAHGFAYRSIGRSALDGDPLEAKSKVARLRRVR